MISKYEIHIKTKCTLYELLNMLKAKGLAVDFSLKSGDCGELMVKFPSMNNIDVFDFKYYRHEDDMYVYEIGAKHKDCLAKMEEIATMIDY